MSMSSAAAFLKYSVALVIDNHGYSLPTWWYHCLSYPLHKQWPRSSAVLNYLKSLWVQHYPTDTHHLQGMYLPLCVRTFYKGIAGLSLQKHCLSISVFGWLINYYVAYLAKLQLSCVKALPSAFNVHGTFSLNSSPWGLFSLICQTLAIKN